MSTLKCPICKEEATYKNNLWNHFKGDHLKDSDFTKKLNLINDDQELDEAAKVYLANKMKIHFFGLTDDNLESLLSNDAPVEQQKESSYSLNDYFNEDSPICREERQFALFLANCLIRNQDKIKKELGFEGYIIKEVYYEATLMRDYWAGNKENFNQALWDYITEKEPSLKEGAYTNTERHASHWKWGDDIKCQRHPLASWMMKAKPDIAVLLENDSDYKLYFLECKYFSGEVVYTDPIIEIERTQTEVQKRILEFLCNNIGLKYNDMPVNEGSVKLVKFFSNDAEGKNDNNRENHEARIKVSDLINYGYKILASDNC